MGQPISNEFQPTTGELGSTNQQSVGKPYDDMIYSIEVSSKNNVIDTSSSMMVTTTSTAHNLLDNTTTDKLSNEKSSKRKSANFTEAISMMHHPIQQQQPPPTTNTTASKSTSTLAIVSSTGSMYHHQRSVSNTSQESPTNNSPPPVSTLSSQNSHKHLSIDSRLFALLNKNSSDSNNRSSRSFQPRPFSISSLDSLGFDGINKVLKDKLLLSQFRNYAKMEYSEENLDIFLVSNQLLEECKKNLDFENSNSQQQLTSIEKRNSSKFVNLSKTKLLKLSQSQFLFEEKMIKKFEKSLEQVIEKMQKMNLEKRKSLMKGNRRKNTEFLGIDRNMFKQQQDDPATNGGTNGEVDLFSFGSSFGSLSISSGLEEINVGKKLKIQIEKIKENNQIQQQWLTSRRASKRMSMKFFNTNTSTTSSTTAGNSGGMSNNSSSVLEGSSSLSPTTSSCDDNLENFEEIPQIKIVKFLEDLRFECLMNLKDTYIRFCQQNKVSVR